MFHGIGTLVSCEAVEQAVAAGAPQSALAPAAAGPARGMRRLPRLRRIVVPQPLAIDMADHCRALGAARPVATGPVLAGSKRTAIRLRAGQDIVIIGRVADAGDDCAALGQRPLHAELVVGAVKIIDVLRDGLALEVLPGAFSDTVAGVDGLRTARRLGAEISPPGLAACARRLRQGLALAIRGPAPAERRARSRAAL